MEEEKYPEVSVSHMHQSANCNLENNASCHMQRQGKVFLCAICQVSFLSEKRFKDHVHSVTSGGQPCVGNDNRAPVNSKPRKRRHTQRNMRHVCEVCQKDFSNKSYLLVHHRIHIGDKPYVCSVCEKAFTVRERLRSHFKTHTGEKPYPCDICEKKFARKYHLTVHMRVHTGEKPYVCDICQRGFSQKWVMYTHRRVHTGERPFECDVCQKGFIYNSQLKIHHRMHVTSELAA